MTFINKHTILTLFQEAEEDGDAYSISGIFAAFATPVTILLDNSTNAFDLNTTFGATTDVDASIRLYEEPPSISANGSAMPVVQLNRTSTNTSGLNGYHTPTLTGSPPLGTELHAAFIPATGNSGGAGSNSGLLRGNWILTAGKKYIIQVTYTGTATVSGDFTFYEVKK